LILLRLISYPKRQLVHLVKLKTLYDIRSKQPVVVDEFSAPLCVCMVIIQMWL